MKPQPLNPPKRGEPESPPTMSPKKQQPEGETVGSAGEPTPERALFKQIKQMLSERVEGCRCDFLDHLGGDDCPICDECIEAIVALRVVRGVLGHPKEGEP